MPECHQAEQGRERHCKQKVEPEQRNETLRTFCLLSDSRRAYRAGGPGRGSQSVWRQSRPQTVL